MSQYYNCKSSVPLRDSGLFEFSSSNQDTCQTIRDIIQKVVQDKETDLHIRYQDHKQLLKLFSMLQSRLTIEEAEKTLCRISFIEDNEDVEEEPHGATEDEGWIPLSTFFENISGQSVADYILHRAFTTHLQPIVQPNGTIIGYEFLTRPLPEQMPFRPAELFYKAKQTGLHSFLDRATRQLAIQMSASHLQNGMKRFINFLPSSLHSPDSCLKSTFDMIKQLGTDPGDYVFEVSESEQLNDPKLKKVFDRYRQEGIRLALDDVGSGFATLDVVNDLQPDYVKMDRKWVDNCHNDDHKKQYIEELLDRVSLFNGVVLAEGVERVEDWNYLKKSGVSLFQGYLFGKASPVPSSIPVGVR